MKPAIESKSIPSEKTITYPPWRDERKFLFSVSDITGAFAMWAVRQSPYASPECLAVAVVALGNILPEKVEFSPAPTQFAELSCDDIRATLEGVFEEIPTVMDWNERKNERKGMGFVSRTSAPNPDDDFIDLDAMARNIAHTLITERLVGEDA